MKGGRELKKGMTNPLTWLTYYRVAIATRHTRTGVARKPGRATSSPGQLAIPGPSSCAAMGPQSHDDGGHAHHFPLSPRHRPPGLSPAARASHPSPWAGPLPELAIRGAPFPPLPATPPAAPAVPDSRASYSCSGACTVLASPLHPAQGATVVGPRAVVGGDRGTGPTTVPVAPG